MKTKKTLAWGILNSLGKVIRFEDGSSAIYWKKSHIKMNKIRFTGYKLVRVSIEVKEKRK